MFFVFVFIFVNSRVVVQEEELGNASAMEVTKAHSVMSVNMASMKN